MVFQSFLKLKSLQFIFWSALTMIGGAYLNDFASFINGGMPVYTNGCFFKISPLDPIHVCATVSTHLGFLCDWIPIAGNIYSIGDFFYNGRKYFIIPFSCVFFISGINRALVS